jgi:hypothetical protein
MYKISSMALYDLCRNRPVCDCQRRRDVSIAFPGIYQESCDSLHNQLSAISHQIDRTVTRINMVQVFVSERNAQMRRPQTDTPVRPVSVRKTEGEP